MIKIGPLGLKDEVKPMFWLQMLGEGETDRPRQRTFVSTMGGGGKETVGGFHN